MLTKTIIDGLEVEYSIVQRKIKYPRLELKTGNLLLVVPKGYKNPEKLIEEHKEWIYHKISAIKESKERSKGKKLNLNRNEDTLRELLLISANKFSRELNVKPNRLTLRNMRSKWGSCSSQKNLNFNKLLKYLPDDLIEYVVLHEIAHLRYKKHDEEFWKIISEKIVNYKEKEKDLMDYWFLIQFKI
jgi:predicted metal-dependent hydrolase